MSNFSSIVPDNVWRGAAPRVAGGQLDLHREARSIDEGMMKRSFVLVGVTHDRRAVDPAMNTS